MRAGGLLERGDLVRLKPEIVTAAGAAEGLDLDQPLLARGVINALDVDPATGDMAGIGGGAASRSLVRDDVGDRAVLGLVVGHREELRWLHIAGRLRLAAADPTVERMPNSPDDQGRTVSGEAIYQYIYAMPGTAARTGDSWGFRPRGSRPGS